MMIKVQNKGHSLVPYFAYGANMSTGKIRDRGLHLPAPGQAARVISDQHQLLSFRHRGGFATLGGCQTDAKIGETSLTYQRTHGVLYHITKQDYNMLSSKETGYKSVQIEVESYDMKRCWVQAFISKPELTVSKPLKPTRRYLDLMISGARQHNLCPTYLAWLENLEAHEGQNLGKEYFETSSIFYADVAVLCIAVLFLSLLLLMIPRSQG